MLTGDVPLTGGEAFIAGYDLKKDIRKIQQRIGYCPQFDALIGLFKCSGVISMSLLSESTVSGFSVVVFLQTLVSILFVP